MRHDRDGRVEGPGRSEGAKFMNCYHKKKENRMRGEGIPVTWFSLSLGVHQHKSIYPRREQESDTEPERQKEDFLLPAPAEVETL